MPGSIFIRPMSSKIWWVALSSPNVSPACEAHNFYVFMGIGNTLTNLIIDPSCRKIGKKYQCRESYGSGQTRCYAHHIGFSNAGLEKTIRIGLCKFIHLEGAPANQLSWPPHLHFVVLFQNKPSPKPSRVAFFPFTSKLSNIVLFFKSIIT